MSLTSILDSEGELLNILHELMRLSGGSTGSVIRKSGREIVLKEKIAQDILHI